MVPVPHKIDAFKLYIEVDSYWFTIFNFYCPSIRVDNLDKIYVYIDETLIKKLWFEEEEKLKTPCNNWLLDLQMNYWRAVNLKKASYCLPGTQGQSIYDQ